jgi:hypothetical protein
MSVTDRYFKAWIMPPTALPCKLQQKSHVWHPHFATCLATKNCAASCNRSWTSVYFSQRCRTSCHAMVFATCLAIFWKNFARSLICGLKSTIKNAHWREISHQERTLCCILQRKLRTFVILNWCNLQCFAFIIVALQVASIIASCNKAFTCVTPLQFVFRRFSVRQSCSACFEEYILQRMLDSFRNKCC